MGKAAEIMAELSYSERKRESRHYGTVTQISSGMVYVLLDGADQPTPCDSRDVKALVNDRVEVEIRDHRATLKANPSRPVSDDAAAMAAANSAYESAGQAADAANSASESSRKALSYLLEVEDDWEAIEEYREDAEVTLVGVHEAATQAIGDAAAAKDAADSAQDAADSAQGSADAAQRSADAAQGAAEDAQEDADRANAAATNAVKGLATVQDVVGLATWMHDHTFLTEDTTVDSQKIYYRQTQQGAWEVVQEPTGNPSAQGWYEADSSVAAFMGAHVALMDEVTDPTTHEVLVPAGLHVVLDENSYYMVLAADGSYVYDADNNLVSKFGESIEFSSSRPQRIGNASSYVEFYDSDSDDVPDAIRISADSITLGGGSVATSSSVVTASGSQYAIHSSATSSTGITGWSDTFVTPTTQKPYVWTRAYYVKDGSRTYGDPACISGAKGDDGTSVTITSIQYGTSSSSTTEPGSWSTTFPSVTKGQWLWVKTTYSDSSTATTKSYMGTDGTDGIDGSQIWTATANATTPDYTFAISDLTGGTGTPKAGDLVVRSYYRYTITSVNTTAGTVLAGSRTSIRGAQGAAGSNGTGITATTVTYGTSSSASTTPSSWDSTAPTSMAEGTWLWTKTYINYSDGTDSTSYSKSYVGTDGTNGTNGTDGTTYYTHIHYSANSDGTGHSASPSSSTLYIGVAVTTSSTAPTAKGSYTWSRYVGEDGDDGHSPAITTSHSGTTTTIYADGVSIGTVEDGEDGSTPTITASKSNGTTTIQVDGTTVATVLDGTSVTVSSIKYGTSDDASTQPSSWGTSVPTAIAQGKWLWVKTTYSDSSTATTKSYVGTDGEDGSSVSVLSSSKVDGTTTVVLTDGTTQTTITIDDGTDGEDGHPGTPGADGTTYYTHFAWANSSDGTTDFSTSVSTGKLYLGVCSTDASADPQTPASYTWTLIKGETGATGKGISSITEYYALNNSTTAPGDSSFSTSVKTPTASNRYVWNYELITYTDSSTTTTAKHICATYGETGAAGKGISSITEYYAVSDSTAAPADSEFSTSVSYPTASNRYLWNYEVIAYTTGNPTTTAKRLIGVYGEKGSDGTSVTVSSVDYSYQLSTSGTTIPTGSWSSSPVAPTSTQYAWTKTVVTYSDSSTATTYTVGGKGGTDGAPGTSVSITTKTVTYQAGTNGTTAPTGTWQSSVPTVPQGGYLWTKTYVKYSTNDETTSYSVSYMGEDGQTGATGVGISSYVQMWAVGSSDETAPSSSSFSPTKPSEIGANEYLWLRVDTTWTDGTTTQGTPAYDANTTGLWRTTTDLTVGQTEIRSAVSSTRREAEAAALAFVPTKHAKGDSDFWYSTPSDAWTALGGGWYHFEYENTGSSAVSAYLSPASWLPVVPGESYTFIVEVRNFSGPTATNLAYLQQMAGAQFWGSSAVSANGSSSDTYIKYADLTDGAFTKRFVKLADVDHIGPETTYDGLCFRYRLYAQPGTQDDGNQTSFDIRISVYTGVYEGAYSEYPMSVRVSTAETEISQNKDAILLRATKTEAYQLSQPNLYPFFSVALTDLAESRESTSGYWYDLEASEYEPVSDSVTVLSDGWAHFEYDNSEGSAVVPVGVLFSRDTYRIKESVTYTVMFEVRNLVSPGTGTTGWTLSCANAADCQAKQGASGFRLDYSEDLADGDTVVYKQFTANNWASTRLWLVALYVGVGAGAVLDCDIRISVYEGVYSGPYKPYVDQSLRDRVRSAETSIEQNSEAIALRATKTEMYESSQPNLQPYFSVKPITDDAGYWSGTFSKWTPGSDGWATLSYTATAAGNSNVAVMPQSCLEAGKDYTILLEWRNVALDVAADMYTVGGDTYQIGGISSAAGGTIQLTAGSGSARRVVSCVNAYNASGVIRSIFWRTRMPGAGSLSGDFRLSIYEGAYDGPYKPYVGSTLYASQAELKVANDEIDLRVEKSGVIAAINASVEEDGGSAVKISADKVNITGTAVFSAINGEGGSTTSIDGGKITAGTVTATEIDATDLHVSAAHIDGKLTIGQTDVSVGGVNLLRNTDLPHPTDDLVRTRSTAVENYVRLTATSSAAYAKWKVDYLDYAEYGGDTYTFSFDARIADATTSYTSVKLNAYIGVNLPSRLDATLSSTYDRYSPAVAFTDLTTTWKRYHITKRVPEDLTSGQASALAAGSFLTASLVTSGSTKPVDVRNWKLERGNAPTGWAASPEDKPVAGGRNLLLGTSEPKVLVTESAGGSYYSDYYVESDWGKAKTNNNTTDVMSVSFDWEYTGSNGEMWVQIGTNIIASVLKAEGHGTRGLQYVDLVGGSGHYQALFRLTSTQASISQQQMRIRTVGTTEGKPLTANATLTVSNLMYEIATVPSAWAPAPEDQITSYTDGVADSLSGRIEDLLATTEAIDGRTQAFEMSETDGLTISSKAEGGSADFNINIKGEAIKFRYQQSTLATASISGFDAPHLGAGTDLTIGPHWRLQWQEHDDRLVLVYV